MYQQNTNRYRNSSSRPNNRFRGGSNAGRRNTFRRSKIRIDIAKYINKNPEDFVEEKYTPSNKITDLKISEKLKENIIKKGYTDLTPIQDQSIPLILEGKDLIGIANTGTGKTAAFLIPLINKAITQNQQKVIIMAPTRELAQQIDMEFKSLAIGLNLYSVLCIGGTSMYSQKRDLQKYHSFLICTPGRIKDLAERRWVNLSTYNNIIMDEVDRMFDMGFQKDINIILNQLPNQKQSLFFSATLSAQIGILVNSHLNNPVKIEINEKKSSTNILQDIVRVASTTTKIDVLHDLLIKQEFTKVIVFIETKWKLNQIEGELKGRGFKVASIHGNKTQFARQRSLSSFRESRTNILLATDVAARGLDIDNVSHVINYDEPQSYDDYVHRIGRTGRGTNKGVALTFV